MGRVFQIGMGADGGFEVAGIKHTQSVEPPKSSMLQTAFAAGGHDESRAAFFNNAMTNFPSPVSGMKG